jgi:DNA processing protein
MRNRIISGLSAGVVVVESDIDGGSMITAKFAGEQGRQVFAVPGRIDQPTSAGCHRLLRDGAILCTGTDDILEELQNLPGISASARCPAQVGKPQPSLSDNESKALAAFRGGEILNLDDLLEQTALPYADLAPALMLLEIKHLVARHLDGTYEASS